MLRLRKFLQGVKYETEIYHFKRHPKPSADYSRICGTELDKASLTLLCEEIYADETIRSEINTGKASLIKTLRTNNLYPPVIYAEKIADAVMALYRSADQESVDLFFDDVELLAQ
jgi:hypothetical protein